MKIFFMAITFFVKCSNITVYCPHKISNNFFNILQCFNFKRMFMIYKNCQHLNSQWAEFLYQIFTLFILLSLKVWPIVQCYLCSSYTQTLSAVSFSLFVCLISFTCFAIYVSYSTFKSLCKSCLVSLVTNTQN